MATLTSYLLRDMPPTLWTSVKQRAKSERRTVRGVLLDLLELYATHGLPARAPFTTKEN